MRRLLAILALLAALAPALALAPDELLKDPALEQRARAISAQLRCLVCQNQSIDDSDAPLAKDLRTLIREQLQQGESDAADHGLRGGALRRVRAAEAAASPRRRWCSGARPLPCC